MNGQGNGNDDEQSQPAAVDTAAAGSEAQASKPETVKMSAPSEDQPQTAETGDGTRYAVNADGFFDIQIGHVAELETRGFTKA